MTSTTLEIFSVGECVDCFFEVPKSGSISYQIDYRAAGLQVFEVPDFVGRTTCPIDYNVPWTLPPTPMAIQRTDKGLQWTGPLTTAETGFYTVFVQGRQGCYEGGTSIIVDIIDCAADELFINRQLITDFEAFKTVRVGQQPISVSWDLNTMYRSNLNVVDETVCGPKEWKVSFIRKVEGFLQEDYDYVNATGNITVQSKDMKQVGVHDLQIEVKYTLYPDRPGIQLF